MLLRNLIDHEFEYVMELYHWMQIFKYQKWVRLLFYKAGIWIRAIDGLMQLLCRVSGKFNIGNSLKLFDRKYHKTRLALNTIQKLNKGLLVDKMSSEQKCTTRTYSPGNKYLFYLILSNQGFTFGLNSVLSILLKL